MDSKNPVSSRNRVFNAQVSLIIVIYRGFILEIRQVAGYNENKSYLGNGGLIDYDD